MAGTLFISFAILLVLVQPYNTLPATGDDHGTYTLDTNTRYYKYDYIVPADDGPIYWRPKPAPSPPASNVIIVEPTNYKSDAEYQRTRQSSSSQPPPSNVIYVEPANYKSQSSSSQFRSSRTEQESDFKPIKEEVVPYYPFYVRSASSDRRDVAEGRQQSESRVQYIDANDPEYQRFASRNYADSNRESSTQKREGESYDNRKYYIEKSDSSTGEPTIWGQSGVRFYYSNGTEVKTYRNSKNQQVMDIYPKQYIIQATETTTTTTSKPTTTAAPIYWRAEIDCPPFYPCNTVMYQPPAQCCKCYLVPNRCCSCNYNTNTNKNDSDNKRIDSN